MKLKEHIERCWQFLSQALRGKVCPSKKDSSEATHSSPPSSQESDGEKLLLKKSKVVSLSHNDLDLLSQALEVAIQEVFKYHGIKDSITVSWVPTKKAFDLRLSVTELDS